MKYPDVFTPEDRAASRVVGPPSTVLPTARLRAVQDYLRNAHQALSQAALEVPADLDDSGYLQEALVATETLYETVVEALVEAEEGK